MLALIRRGWMICAFALVCIVCVTFVAMQFFAPIQTKVESYAQDTNGMMTAVLAVVNRTEGYFLLTHQRKTGVVTCRFSQETPQGKTNWLAHVSVRHREWPRPLHPGETFLIDVDLPMNGEPVEIAMEWQRIKAFNSNGTIWSLRKYAEEAGLLTRKFW